MSWLSSFIGDVTGSNAANAAINAQNESTDAAIDLQREMFNYGVQQQQPWSDAQMSFMGITPSRPQGGGGGGGGQASGADYSGYVSGSPDLMNAFSTLSGRDMTGIASAGFDADGNGQISQGEFGNYHHSTYGQQEGRQLPANAFASGGESAPQMGGGFDYTNNPLYTSMMNTTQADFDMYRDSFGAGGAAMSGQYLEALNDANRRNESTAVGNVWNALSGGQVSASNQANQASAFANSVSSLEAQRGAANASSYQNQGNQFSSLLRTGIGAASGAWF